MTAIPQDAALRMYLAMIAGDAPRSQYFEVRWKRSSGGMGQDFVPLSEPDRVARMIRNRGQMTDTYIGLAPRTERKGGLDATPRVHCLWVDCDSRESVERLARFRPLPSIVIRSGTPDHAHAYWPLGDSVPAGWAKRANQRLARALGADRVATDAARILRPPCTLSHKHDPARPVVCTRLEASTRSCSPGDRVPARRRRLSAARASGTRTGHCEPLTSARGSGAHRARGSGRQSQCGSVLGGLPDRRARPRRRRGRRAPRGGVGCRPAGARDRPDSSSALDAQAAA